MNKEATEKMSAISPWMRVLGWLPREMRAEIEHLGASRRDFPLGVTELRLRANGKCSVVFIAESIPLLSTVSEEQTEQIMRSACAGSVYAFRDTVAEGYIPIGDGIRVGICGRARYDGGALVGVCGVSSLVFRLPHGECEFAEEICKAFRDNSRSGMLIYSPPGCGKTTALRSIARILSSGAGSKRVCIIDERCEFTPESYINCEVDILRGYKRDRGIEIATRTLTPEIIIIDEIGSDEARALGEVIRCGIPVIATAHAGSIDELVSKPRISELIRLGAFDLFVGITKAGREFGFVITALPEE